MNLVRATLSFLYDLVIGDSWPLTVAVVAVVGVGIELRMTHLLPIPILAVGMALAIMILASLVIIGEVHRGRNQRER